MVRAAGVEPAKPALSTPYVCPFHHTRTKKSLVEVKGVEPLSAGCRPAMFPVTPHPHAGGVGAPPSEAFGCQRAGFPVTPRTFYRNTAKTWGGSRDLNPSWQGHGLQCFHYTRVADEVVWVALSGLFGFGTRLPPPCMTAFDSMGRTATRMQTRPAYRPRRAL